MNPSSLLNVSPDLMREHALHGAPDAPLGPATDRGWAIGIGLATLALVALLYAVLG